MKRIISFGLLIGLFLSVFMSCDKSGGKADNGKDTVYVEIPILPSGDYTFNMPCQITSIHGEKEGKAWLVLWLHGGVALKDRIDFQRANLHHLNCSSADDSIMNYLKKNDIKSLVLKPMCVRRNWADCDEDVINIVRGFVEKGIIDEQRIYVAGSSDGGVGSWHFASKYGDIFAAAISLSNASAKPATIPVYWQTTDGEGDRTAVANQLNADGGKVIYQHNPGYWHAKDEWNMTMEYLGSVFSNHK